jgi:pilus assembly protein CpaB
MKPKTIVLMVIAVGAGLAASFFTSRYLVGSSQPAAPPAEEEVPVLIAKQPIAAYTLLKDPKMFEVKMMRKGDVTKDTVTDFAKVDGRTLKYAMGKGKVLAESDLLPPGQDALHSKLRPGERLMSVKVTPDTAAAGFILPGSRVDVLATQIRHSDTDQPYTKTLLQDIEVMAIDQQVQAPDSTVAKLAERVTLRVTLEQAEILSVYADTGTLRLVLRNPNDRNIVETRGGTISVRTPPSRLINPHDLNTPSGPVGTETIAPPVVPDGPSSPTPVAETPKHVMTIINNTVQRFEFEKQETEQGPRKPR